MPVASPSAHAATRPFTAPYHHTMSCHVFTATAHTTATAPRHLPASPASPPPRRRKGGFITGAYLRITGKRELAVWRPARSLARCDLLRIPIERVIVSYPKVISQTRPRAPSYHASLLLVLYQITSAERSPPGSALSERPPPEHFATRAAVISTKATTLPHRHSWRAILEADCPCSASVAPLDV